MSKSWVLVALFIQLIILIFVYRLFKNDSAHTEQGKIIGAQMDSTHTQELTNSALRQIEAIEIDWSKIPQKQTPPKGDMHDKWIVLTTINAPTSDVKKLAGIEGWKVVVVGDTKTPADWRYTIFICLFMVITLWGLWYFSAGGKAAEFNQTSEISRLFFQKQTIICICSGVICHKESKQKL